MNTTPFRSRRASSSPWPAVTLLLVLLATVFLACLARAQDALPVATPASPELPASGFQLPTSPSLPPTALVITVLVPLLIAAAKKLFPNLPSASLPVIAPVLGAALEFALSRYGLNGGGTVAGAVAGGAGVGLREIVDQSRRSQLPASTALLALGLLLFTPGCTTFMVKQGDVSPDRSITFELRGTAYGSGQQAITQLKALQTDKSQSFGTDTINNKGPTNAVEVIRATTALLNAAKP